MYLTFSPLCVDDRIFHFILNLEIDCGQPENIPGSLNPNVTNTTFGSQYEIKCSDLYRLKGNSSYGNNIWCGSDGQWNYGNLRCDGQYKFA